MFGPDQNLAVQAPTGAVAFSLFGFKRQSKTTRKHLGNGTIKTQEYYTSKLDVSFMYRPMTLMHQTLLTIEVTQHFDPSKQFKGHFEVSRFSYRVGLNNDSFDSFTILLYPGEYIVDNRPGLRTIQSQH